MGQGGKGANQAVAVKRLAKDEKVTFISKVGTDVFGENALKQYASEKLDISGIMRSTSPSGVALIAVDDIGENSIIVASGANADWSEKDIEEHRTEIENADILLLQLEIPMPAVLKAAKIASEAGVFVVLNPAPYIELPKELYHYISLIIPNETEMSMMVASEINNETDVIESVQKLTALGVENVIVTLGSKGSLVMCEGQTKFIPARKVQALDTTAAGDTFCAGVCVALAEGKNLFDAAQFATCASSLAVQKVGAQDSIPFRAEVDELNY